MKKDLPPFQCFLTILWRWGNKGPFLKSLMKSYGLAVCLGNVIYEESPKFFCKGADIKYFWLCMLCMVSVAYSSFSYFYKITL